ETAAAIYIWCIFADRRTAGGISLVMERLSSRKNAAATLYCRAASQKSRDFFLTLGFRESATPGAATNPGLMVYPRNPGGAEPQTGVGASGEARKPAVQVEVCRTLDDLQQIIAIRSATYVAEHECPYNEEFDGNDLVGMHLIARCDSTPIGCIRLRFFAGFAKVERLAVLKHHRSATIANALIRKAIEICSRKGYTRLYGQCEPKVAPLWIRFGFKPRTSDPTFSFSDRDYLEGDLVLDARVDAITIDSDPLTIIRPEGAWDDPGVLDHSALRRPSPLHNWAKKLRDAAEDDSEADRRSA
ncbi:MAG TPA: GNAT family N-acetyltransferase, partial [Rhizobiaceae bacterium]|nr:GNAT family N-acetyltransferase [Rhizobiaceae bacterium]